GLPCRRRRPSPYWAPNMNPALVIFGKIRIARALLPSVRASGTAAYSLSRAAPASRLISAADAADADRAAIDGMTPTVRISRPAPARAVIIVRSPLLDEGDLTRELVVDQRPQLVLDLVQARHFPWGKHLLKAREVGGQQGDVRLLQAEVVRQE